MEPTEKEFVPELGQMAFGCPTSEFNAPDFVIAGLIYLADEIERVQWNLQQKEFSAPTNNNAGEFKTDTFEMFAYYWGDDEILCNRANFKCGDFEIRWYKYLGRGTSMNKSLDANTFFLIIDRCLKSVRALDVKIY